MKYEKCYVYYATENYFEVVKKSIESVRKYSDLPIYLYLLNSDLKCEIENVFTIKWECDITLNDEMYEKFEDNNFYIESLKYKGNELDKKIEWNNNINFQNNQYYIKFILYDCNLYSFSYNL